MLLHPLLYRKNGNPFIIRGLLIIVFLSSFSVLRGDILYLKDNRVITGEILRQDLFKVVVRTKNGRVNIKKEEISRIKYMDDSEQEEVIVEMSRRNQSKFWREDLKRVLEKRRAESEEQTVAYQERSEEEEGFFQQEERELNNRVQDNALRRSIFVPGWGQFYKNHDYRGYAVAGGMGLSLFGIKMGYDQYISNKKAYNDLNTLYLAVLYKRHNLILSSWAYSTGKQYRSDMENGMKFSLLSAGILAGLYFFGMGDAYFSDPDHKELNPTEGAPEEGGDDLDNVDELAWQAQGRLLFQPQLSSGVQDGAHFTYSFPLDFN